MVNNDVFMKTTIETAQCLSRRFGPLPSKEIEWLSSVLRIEKVAKGAILLDKGQIAKYITYVDLGLLRQFYYKNGHDVTEHFACEGTLMYCIQSLFRQEPTELMAEAIEASVLYCIPYEELVKQSMQSIYVAQFVRKILEDGLICSQVKANSWRFETAEERYLRFLREFPQAAREAPVGDIASYLLMTPETLSRMRRKVVSQNSD